MEVATNSHILIIIEIMHYKPNNTTKLVALTILLPQEL